MTVRFGIMGLGGIAHRFAKALKMAQGTALVAAASSDEARATQFAAEYGVAKAYGSYEALAKDPAVDVVYIAQTHDRHYELIQLCIAHKKGVLCEKPMVLTEQQARTITALAKENNVLLMEAMWSRFIPAFQKAREWVSGGKIGAVRLLQASFCFNAPYDPNHRLYNAATAGGSLYDTGVYSIEFATGILGENPIEVKAVGTRCENGVDDFVAMSMKFKSGALASLSCGFRSTTGRDGYIYGEEGSVVLHNFHVCKKVELYDKNQQLLETFECEFEDGFLYEIQHFAELYRTGKIESDIIPHRDNIATTQIFEAVLAQI